MGLLSFLQRTIAAAPATTPVTERDSVGSSRVRARRRLIGASLLVLLGVVGLPLLFDTAPRPLPVDIPIDIPRKDALPPLTVPAVRPNAKASSAAIESSRDAMITESAVDSARAATPTTPAIAPAAKPAAARAEERPAANAADKQPAPAIEKVPPVVPKIADSARARAALEGRSAAISPEPRPSEASGRFVVQVGAFSEADLAREARARVEKLGLKTYTQVVETPAGKRIRVRLGPYAERGEAEKAAAQLKQAGLGSAVLTL